MYGAAGGVLTTDMTLTRWVPDSKVAILTTLMVASTAMNIILSLECAHFRETVRDTQSRRSVPNAKVLSFTARSIDGSTRSFTARSIDGSTRSFTFSREKMLILYAFSPACVWSHRNHPNAVSLSKKLGTQADFVAVSLIDNQTLLETYVAEHRCPFSVLFGVTPTLKKDLRMAITPQLLVLSSTGEPLKVWSGHSATRIARR